MIAFFLQRKIIGYRAKPTLLSRYFKHFVSVVSIYKEPLLSFHNNIKQPSYIAAWSQTTSGWVWFYSSKHHIFVNKIVTVLIACIPQFPPGLEHPRPPSPPPPALSGYLALSEANMQQEE